MHCSIKFQAEPNLKEVQDGDGATRAPPRVLFMHGLEASRRQSGDNIVGKRSYGRKAVSGAAVDFSGFGTHAPVAIHYCVPVAHHTCIRH